mgnify:CR=1 FL=1
MPRGSERSAQPERVRLISRPGGVHRREGKRLVIVLHYWLDLPLEEIAGMLGLPVGTVASRLARAKVELRTVLEGDRVV